MYNQNEFSYCEHRLLCGTCKITGKICPIIEKESKDIAEISNIPKTRNESLWDWVPQACRQCSSHPMNGGSGLCTCTLAYQNSSTLYGETSVSMNATDGDIDSSKTEYNFDILTF